MPPINVEGQAGKVLVVVLVPNKGLLSGAKLAPPVEKQTSEK